MELEGMDAGVSRLFEVHLMDEISVVSTKGWSPAIGELEGTRDHRAV